MYGLHPGMKDGVSQMPALFIKLHRDFSAGRHINDSRPAVKLTVLRALYPSDKRRKLSGIRDIPADLHINDAVMRFYGNVNALTVRGKEIFRRDLPPVLGPFGGQSASDDE